MAFFEMIPEEKMAPEAREWIEIAKKRQRKERVAPGYYVMAKHPPLLKAFVQALEDLIPIPSRFGWAQHISGMLIAHAKRCHACFDACRYLLLKVGFDEIALDKMCQAPSALPLPDRDRWFVEFTLRVATDPGGVKIEDFREMERRGFSEDEILAMVGVAGCWNFITTISSALEPALPEG